MEGEVEIYAPDELKCLLENARKEMLPYLTIAAFTGLRQAELARLDWTEVKEDHILVMGGIAKTKTSRQVDIPENLAAWLNPLRQQSGPVVPYLPVNNQLVKLAAKAELEWKHNGLRHSFGSFRLAKVKDPAVVAYEMGNTPAMVFKHYRKVVGAAEATRVAVTKHSTASRKLPCPASEMPRFLWVFGRVGSISMALRQ